MKRPLTRLRLGVVLLFMIGLLSPLAAIGAGAQTLTCDDFNSERAAQAVLDSDPALEESLDPDGNGIACDHEDDPTDDPADDPTDEPSGDGDDYLADIQDEVDSVVESLDRYADINAMVSDASATDQAEMIAEAEDIAAGWEDYPDVAAEYEAPEGLEDVEDAYLDFADVVGETGDAWLTWWDIPQGDPEEDAAFDEFSEAYDLAYDEADNVSALIEDAAGSSNPSGDVDPYVEDIQGELDLLTEQVDRFLEIDSLGADASRDEIDELNGIAADWEDYPDVASEFEAPEGYEEIEAAYLDLADAFGEAGELWEVFWEIDPALEIDGHVARRGQMPTPVPVRIEHAGRNLDLPRPGLHQLDHQRLLEFLAGLARSCGAGRD